MPLPAWSAALAGAAQRAAACSAQFATGALRDAAGDALLGAVRRHGRGLRLAARRRRRSSPSSSRSASASPLPYLLVAAFPGLARAAAAARPLDDRLRRILGLLLAGTAVWLLDVLAAQIGLGGEPASAAIAGRPAGAAPGACGRSAGRQRLRGAVARHRRSRLLAAYVLRRGSPRGRVPAPPTGPGSPSTRRRIAGLVGEGKTVFVDVTADWCVTCLVNKRLVLDRGAVGRAAAPAGKVVAMQADWTRPDDGIARYLAAFGRYGIPFNAVYGPGGARGHRCCRSC